jgi:hypothetical protein
MILLRLAGVLWARRWNIGRLVVAAFLLWCVAVQEQRRIAAIALASLPDYDYAAEIRAMRAAGRYGEAICVADTGVALLSGEARAAVERERAATIELQSSWLRRFKDFSSGAVTGQAETTEALFGVVASDFFVVGDVRDLLVQSIKYATAQDTDPLIAGLSAFGLATTLVPEIDWAASVLKFARRTGAIGSSLASGIVRTLRAGDAGAVRRLIDDAGVLARRASPGGAATILRSVNDPEELAAVARFVDRHADAARGATALRIAGRDGVELVLRGADAEAALLKASAKGAAGVRLLRGGAASLLRPHPIVGILKGLTKGTLPEAVGRALMAAQGHGVWLFPVLAGWCVAESVLLAWGVRGAFRRAGSASASRP